MLNRLSVRGKILFAVISAYLVGAGINTYVISEKASSTILSDNQMLVESEARRYVGEVEDILNDPMIVARNFVYITEELKQAGLTDRATFDAIQRGFLRGNPFYLGIWSMWEPNAFDGKDAAHANANGTDATGRYLPYWNRGSDTGEIAVEPSTDYDNPEEYYQVTLHGKKETMDNPAPYPVAGKQVLMTSAMIPFKFNNEFIGVNGIDIAMDTLQKKVSALKPLGVGYVRIVSNNGKFVSHPEEARNGEDIGEDELAASIKNHIAQNQSFSFFSQDAHLGKKAFNAMIPIHIGKSDKTWGLIVTVPTHVITDKSDNLLLWSLITAACSMLLGIIIAMLISRSVTSPLLAMTETMSRLAKGDRKVEVPALHLNDEVGQMAAAVSVFKQNAIEMDKKREEEKEIQKQKEIQLQKMQELTQLFRQEIGKVTATLAKLSNLMQERAQGMKGVAEKMRTQSSQVSQDANEADHSMTVVASSTEELTASIGDIASQISRSSRMAEDTAHKASQADSTMRELATTSQDIQQIIDLIREIAGQTNLLALNATIEAARAGDAGKGFAVVASEVKNLAGETDKATDNISQMIQKIVESTHQAVEDTVIINQSVKDMSGAITEIHNSVTMQSKATEEISGSTQKVAHTNRKVVDAAQGFNKAAEQTLQEAQEVLKIANQLAEQSSLLNKTVSEFLGKVAA